MKTIDPDKTGTMDSIREVMSALDSARTEWCQDDETYAELTVAYHKVRATLKRLCLTYRVGSVKDGSLMYVSRDGRYVIQRQEAKDSEKGDLVWTIRVDGVPCAGASSLGQARDLVATMIRNGY